MFQEILLKINLFLQVDPAQYTLHIIQLKIKYALAVPLIIIFIIVEENVFLRIINKLRKQPILIQIVMHIMKMACVESVFKDIF